MFMFCIIVWIVRGQMTKREYAFIYNKSAYLNIAHIRQIDRFQLVSNVIVNKRVHKPNLSLNHREHSAPIDNNCS